MTLLKNQAVLEVVKTHNNDWQITTSQGIFTATNVIDTRPTNPVKDEDSILWQSFIGVEIETNSDCFNATQFVLMDIDANFNQGLGFIYLLPFTANRALIEYTVFSENTLCAELLKEYLKPALIKYLNNTDYNLVRTEFGQLPMGNKKVKQSKNKNKILMLRIKLFLVIQM